MAKEEKSPEVVANDPEADGGNRSAAESEFDDVFKAASKGESAPAKAKAAPDADSSKDNEKKAAADDAGDKQPGDEKPPKADKKVEKEDDRGDQDGDGSGEDGNPDEKPEKPAKETAEQRIERKAGELKARREKESEEQQEEEPPPPPKKAQPKAQPKAKQEAHPSEDDDETDEELEALLEKLATEEDEKEYAGDYREALRLNDKLVKARVTKGVRREIKAFLGDLTPKLEKTLESYGNEIASLRSELYLTKHVPDWEKIVYAEDGRTENGEFWEWVKTLPKLWQALAASDNPEDNVEILKYYKESRAKDELEKARSKKAKDREKYEAMHGNSPEGGRVTREEGKSKDFSGSFAEFAS